MKPKKLGLWDGSAECDSGGDYDDHGGGAFCVTIDAPSIYDAANVRKLINWLEKAERWIARKEGNPLPAKKSKAVTYVVRYTDPDFPLDKDNVFVSGKRYKSLKDFDRKNPGLKGLELYTKRPMGYAKA